MMLKEAQPSLRHWTLSPVVSENHLGVVNNYYDPCVRLIE